MVLMAVLTLTSLLAFALAQGEPGDARAVPPRLEVHGRAWTKDRKPWADASVVLLSRPLPWRPGFGEADLLRVTTDAKGRFRARVLSGRRYSCWALEASGDEYRVSAVAEDLVPGRGLVLREVAKRRCTRVRLLGSKLWKPTLVARVRSDTHNVHVEDLRPSATVTLPPMPGTHCVLELRTGKGMPVLLEEVELTGKELRIQVPAPREVEIQALSMPRDHAIAHAELQLTMARTTYYPHHFARGHKRDAMGNDWVTIGKTDAKGRCTLTLPDTRGRKAGAWIAVRSSKHSVGFAGLDDDAPGRFSIEHAGGASKLRVWLSPTRELVGRIEITRGRPAAGLEVVCEGPMRHLRKTKKYVSRTSYDARLLRCDARGGLRLALSGRQRLIAQIPGSEHKALLWARSEKGEDAELGVIVMDELPELELAITAPDGRPQVADVYIDRYFERDRTPPARFLEVRSGHRGRAKLRLPRGRYQVAVIAPELGYHLAEVDVGKDGKRLAVQLEAMKIIRGRVVDDNARPIPRARLQVRASNTSGGARMRKFVERLGWVSLDALSDDEGRFECRFVPYPDVAWSLYVTEIDGQKVEQRQRLRVRSASILDAKMVY